MTSVISGDGAVPDAVLAAFWAYERALAEDDLAALDDAFVDDPGTLRGDAAGLLVGHEQISAFRGARGGAPRRTVRELHGRALGPDHVALVAVNEPVAGGAGLVTQVWQHCPDGRWRIAVAQVAGPAPAADPRVWRLVGHPLVPASASGVLDGASVAVKDLFAVEGFAVGAGNPAYLAEAETAGETAAAVRALLGAGAQIRGIARTDEFAFSIAGANSHYGTPPNPRAPLRLPGGSSNGPASAVAMGHADLGLGTDTAGSIRVPASYQGLWGLRTTHGAVGRDGLLALAPSFDTVGWLTRDPDLLARAAQVSLDPGTAPTTPTAASDRFAVCPALLEVAHPSVRAAFTAALDTWMRLGALPAPDRVELPDPHKTIAAFRTVQGAEAWREHGAWLTKHPDRLGTDIAARFAWAASITPSQEAEARVTLAQVRTQIDDALGDSILLLPATPTAAPLRSADSAEIDAVRSATVTLTCLAAITGRPALSAPLLEADGAPVGISLLGPRNADTDLIARAAPLATAIATTPAPAGE